MIASPPDGAEVHLPICTGFDPEQQIWGAKDSDSAVWSFCPKNHAVMAVRPPLGPERAGEAVPVFGFCCPLPPGALGEEQMSAGEVCPADSVVTGSQKINDAHYRLRCTKVVPPFTLGELSAPQRIEPYEEFFSELRELLAGGDAPRSGWGAIPASIRYGFGRIDRTRWTPELCFASQPGALLTGRRGKYCAQHEFRQLMVRDVGGSEHVVTALHCDAIDDPLRPDAECLKRESASR